MLVFQKIYFISGYIIIKLKGDEKLQNHRPDKNHLLANLQEILSCTFYWGKIDQYEAKKLLDGRPDGTFLLRDSADVEHLFSVSFAYKGETRNYRIIINNPRIVSASEIINGIKCTFKRFQIPNPAPHNRPHVFTLQELCRAEILSHKSFHEINEMHAPESIKRFLREYHFKLKLNSIE